MKISIIDLLPNEAGDNNELKVIAICESFEYAKLMAKGLCVKDESCWIYDLESNVMWSCYNHKGFKCVYMGNSNHESSMNPECRELTINYRKHLGIE